MTPEHVFEKIGELAREMMDAISFIAQLKDERERDNGLAMVLHQIGRTRVVVSDRSQLLRDWDAAPAFVAARHISSVLAYLASVRPGLTHRSSSTYADKVVEEELAAAVRLVTRLEAAAGPAGEVESVMQS